MTIEKIDKKNIGLWSYLCAFVANADIEVLKKHPYVRRDINNLALLMCGMGTLIFALQYLALSSYTGEQKFGLFAALLSAGIIFLLDRIVVGGDYDTEGKILYLEEKQANKRVIQQLKLKRTIGMGLRVSLGMAIAYAAVTLSMSGVLNYETEGYFDKMEIDQNPKPNMQLQTAYDEINQSLYDKKQSLKELEVELSNERIHQEDSRRRFTDDIRTLEVKRENSESKSLFAKNCANAERTGITNKACNSTGKTGTGKNFRYWRRQAELHEKQVEKFSQIIAEKQKHIEQLSANPAQSFIEQRIATIRQDIDKLNRDMESKLRQAKLLQKQIGSRVEIVRKGPIAVNDATIKVINAASDYTQHTLVLLKYWVMLLELCVFVARFAGCGKDYALALHKERLLRNRITVSPSTLAAIA